MPAPPQRWPELRPEVADLRLLAHHDQGIYDEVFLAEQGALLNHKAVVSRRQANPEAPMIEVIETAVADVGRWAVPSSKLVSGDEHEAVKLLLGIVPPTNRRRRPPHGERARQAFITHLGGSEFELDAWRRHRRTGGSDETDLLGRWIRVLDQLDVPPSATTWQRAGKKPPLLMGHEEIDAPLLMCITAIKYGTRFGSAEARLSIAVQFGSHPPTTVIRRLMCQPMAHRIGPSEGEAQLFAIRLTDAQRALLDEMVQENPKDSRSAILRRAFDEYVERRSKADPAA